MAGLTEAIEIKRRMFFEHDGAPFHCIDVEISRPTARGGQTLVRIKMRNLLTRAVFDKTFKAGEKFKDPDLEMIPASYLYGGDDGYHFMDQNTFDTVTLGSDMIGGDRELLSENMLVQIQKYNGRPIGVGNAPACRAQRYAAPNRPCAATPPRSDHHGRDARNRLQVRVPFHR